MNKPARLFRQSGFSLLEVLVTMAIIAIGLLGFASMLVQSMKTNRMAMQRSMATFYAYDIIDCMRVNKQAATAGDYTRDFTDTIPTGTSVADTDLKLWLNSLSAELPSSDVLPSGASIAIVGNTVTVQIRWSESLTSDDNAIHIWKTVSTL